MFVRSDREWRRVQRAIKDGLTDREIAALTGIPRATVNRWRRLRPRRRPGLTEVDPDWRPSKPAAYCYLLGLYLGDGHIWHQTGQTPWLRLTLDARYEGIVREAVEAIRNTVPGADVRLYSFPGRGDVIVHSRHALWIHAFPQHGKGKKHTRPIALRSWQLELTTLDPHSLIRGLIHSDGCRTVNQFSVRLPSGRIREYAYTRYFFTNLAADIRRIFCDHCDLIGVRWTQSSLRNISISNRNSVAVLDSFVGPKT